MASFINKEQIMTITSYKGPSGQVYEANKGLPFLVHNDSDIAYFRSVKEFKETGIIEALLPKSNPPEDKVLEVELKKLKFKPETIKKLVEAYGTLDNLKQDLQDDYKLEEAGFEVTKAQINKLKTLLNIEVFE